MRLLREAGGWAVVASGRHGLSTAVVTRRGSNELGLTDHLRGPHDIAAYPRRTLVRRQARDIILGVNRIGRRLAGRFLATAANRSRSE